MGSLSFAAIVVLCAFGCAACGAVSMLMASRARIPKHVAFGWGAALGPIGVAVCAVVAARTSVRRTPAPEPWV